ncbi:MAG TPA: hypothetical protein VGJ33_12285 [Candidatus Angelobacter sp.]
MSSENWQALVQKNLGLTATLGKIMLSVKPPINLPDAERLLVASDYSGAHRGSAYDVYTTLVADASSCAAWLESRAHIRAQFLSQNRRMSYKALNDGQKRRALGPFLAAADQISGICASFAISKAAGTIFQADDQPHNPELSECLEWPKPLFERTFRIVHIVSFFIAGLSRPNQDVLWFSDEDEIAASPKRLIFLTKLWANVLSNYAVHSFRHLRCGTTASDDGSNSIEDLAAIPDLVAGALSDLLTSVEGNIRSKIITPFPLNSKPKAAMIGQ